MLKSIMSTTSKLTIGVTKRSMPVKEARKNNLIPAVIYSKNYNESVYLEEKVFTQLVHQNNHKILTTLCHIKLEKENIIAIVKDISFHPITERITHVDFLKLDDSSLFEISAEIEAINADKCVAIKDGGIIYKPSKYIKILCTISTMTPVIYCDIKDLHKGSVVMSKDIPNIKFVKNVPLISILKE
jgi:large subunit ribosomal protein L25